MQNFYVHQHFRKLSGKVTEIVTQADGFASLTVGSLADVLILLVKIGCRSQLTDQTRGDYETQNVLFELQLYQNQRRRLSYQKIAMNLLINLIKD